MASILSNPKYQPHGGSELGTNAFTYLKFGLPRIVPPKVAGGSSSAGTPGNYLSLMCESKTIITHLWQLYM